MADFVTKEEFSLLQSEIAAQDLLLRALYAKWVTEDEDDDPSASAFRIIEGMIGSMHGVVKAEDAEDAAWLGDIEDHLRGFEARLQTRLAGKARRAQEAEDPG